MSDHSAGRNHGAPTDPHARQDGRIRADPYVILNYNLSTPMPLHPKGDAWIVEAVVAGATNAVWAEGDAVTDDDFSAVIRVNVDIDVEANVMADGDFPIDGGQKRVACCGEFRTDENITGAKNREPRRQ